MNNCFYQSIKRSFDVLSSLVAIVITLPLWIIIAVAIKMSSEGPVFYRTKRIGKNRKEFTLYKFRSMHVFCPDAAEQGQVREKGALVNKDRIFAVGNFLRKSKMDELPQFLNVFLGHMSIIGPRPLTMAGIKRQYSGEYECITSIRPGLACLDSLFDYVHGENEVNDNTIFMEKIMPVRRELAKMYVKNRSIRLDVYCIFRTIKLIFEVVVLRKNEFPYNRYEIECREKVFGHINDVTQR